MAGEKLPPFDAEAEEVVLATALVEPQQVPLFTSILRPQDFFREKNRWVWEAILKVVAEGGTSAVNQVTVAYALRDKLGVIGGAAYLSQMIADLPTPFIGESAARHVKRLSIYRQTISAAQQIAQMAFKGEEEPSALLGKASALVEGVAKDTALYSPTRLAEAIDEFMRAPSFTDQGVMTGWPSLNALLGPLRPGMLYVVAGRPSKGKSSLVINLMRDVLVEGKHKALLFSLEMGKPAVVARMLACETGIDSLRIERRLLDDKEEARVTLACGQLTETDSWLDTKSLGLIDIYARAVAQALRERLELVVVDHLQQIQIATKASRYEKVTEAVHGVKALATEIDAPVVLVSQLSRSPEGRADHRPLLSDLRESGAIEQCSDAVIFLHDDREKPSSDPHRVEVLLDKNRLGRTGAMAAWFYPATCRFVEVESDGR